MLLLLDDTVQGIRNQFAPVSVSAVHCEQKGEGQERDKVIHRAAATAQADQERILAKDVAQTYGTYN